MENVIIVGGGPAGISAAVYAARANLNPLLIENGAGSLAKAEKIENYYGLDRALSGEELYRRGIAQARAFGVRIITAQVLGIEGFEQYIVKTTSGDFSSRSVILATGARHQKPEIPGIKEYEGRGVSYCAICDAFFFRGKKTAVLGNGDFALHEAEILKNASCDVTLFTDGKAPAFSRIPSVNVNTKKIIRIIGEDRVQGIQLEQENSLKNEGTLMCPAEGVFIAFGSAGSAEIARQMGAELTEKGNIQINEKMETSIPGIFAAGDCTGGLLQVAKAVYEGAQAALSVGKYIRQKGKE